MSNIHFPHYIKKTSKILLPPLIATILISCLLTALAIAQSWDVTDFSTGQHDWEVIYDYDDFNVLPNCPSSDLAGVYDTGVSFVGDLCAGTWPNFYYSLLIESPEISVSPGGGKVRVYLYDCSVGFTKYNSTNYPVYQLITTTWSAATLDHPTEQNYWIIDENATQLRIGGQVYAGSGSCTSRFYTVEYEDITTEGGAALTCSTVDYFHFTEGYTDSWQLSAGAVVSDSLLTLPELDYARQNLTLQANKTYNAVISVTSVTTDTDFYLKVSLGSTYENLTITQTGLYTAVLHTPASLAGPILYTLLNDPLPEYIPLFDPQIDIDWTCLYLDADANPECIAPTNGEFSSANYWDWHRGADWDSLNQNAFLPYDTQGLIISTLTYSMPVITSGQYLILEFDSSSPGTGGIIGARAKNTTTTLDYLASTYPTWYTYQADLSGFSGLTDVSLHFANPGIGGCPGYTSTNHVNLDNVCLYVSDEAPQLPFVSDEDAPPPGLTWALTIPLAPT